MSKLAISNNGLNNTANILEKLKSKPVLMPKEDVKIVITTQPKGTASASTVTIGQKTKLSADMDNGEKAKAALELLRQRKITGVSEKFPEQKVEFMEPKAPVIETKKPIIKKLTAKKVGLEEESGIEGEMIPVVGEQGLEMVLEKGERERVAHHEAGHAIMSFILKDSSHPIKVSILPRGENALGFSQPKPEDRKLYTQNYLLAQICVLLGGRVAEKIIYGNYSSGASDDIEKATTIVKHWFLTWGMDNSSGALNYLELDQNKISEDMINKIRTFIKDAEKFTYNILNSNKEYIISLAKLLLNKETIIYSDISELLPKELENKIETIDF